MPYADPIVRKQKLREAYLRRMADPEYRRKVNEKQAATARLPETKERLRLAHKRRYANPEYRNRVRAQNRDWGKAHKANGRKRALAWRNRNLEQARANANQWHKQHRARRRDYEHVKRARVFASTVNRESIEHFMALVKSKRSAVCYYCERRVSTQGIHFDHIIPLSKGGPHSIENLCVACVRCNQSKHAKRLQDFITLGQQILEL